jgi:hypothetical protein
VKGLAIVNLDQLDIAARNGFLRAIEGLLSYANKT